MKKYLAYLLFSVFLFPACQQAGENKQAATAKEEMPGQVQERTNSSGNTVISAPPPPSSIETNVLAIEEAYKDALPYMPFMKSIQIGKESDCTYTFLMDYDEGEKSKYKVDLTKLDLGKMNVFFDQNGYPGIRVFSKDGQYGIYLSVNDGEFQPAEEMVMKQDDRENTAKVTFALRDMIKKCAQN